MIMMDKTRIILDGKTLDNIKNCAIFFDFTNNTNIALISIPDQADPIVTTILNFDVVEENSHKKDLETVTWTQIICNTIRK